MDNASKLLELARGKFDTLTEAEEKLFRAVANGEVADYSATVQEDNNPAKADNWVVLLQRPHIVLPPHYGGPEFKEGFEHANAIPPEAVYLLRAMEMPYSQISNKPITEEQIEYGSLQSVLDRLNKEMENQEDIETGLIKGVLNGADISLMRYSLGLAIKSAPGNVKEFFEHLRRRRGEPIRPDERITDEDIRRLFG